ncbi:MAG: TPM domain-containing protein [Clostridia bacterium]|nr:TPM domain-containing protein [Clostridia bacterium]
MVRKLLAVLLALLLPTASLADAAQVIDDAQVLTEAARSRLSAAIVEAEEMYPVDLVVLLTYDVPADDSDTLWRVHDFADDFYDNGGYGAGGDSTGMLYLIDLNNGVQYISTCGMMIRWIDDAGEEMILDAAEPYLYDADWEAGALAAVRETAEQLRTATAAAQPAAETDTTAVAASLLPLALILSIVILGGGV